MTIDSVIFFLHTGGPLERRLWHLLLNHSIDACKLRSLKQSKDLVVFLFHPALFCFGFLNIEVLLLIMCINILLY